MGASSVRSYEREVKLAVPGAAWSVRKSVRWTLSLSWMLMLLCVLRVAVADDDVSLLDNYPGRLIAVGDHRLHLYCIGSGAPTVVFESGIGGLSLEWRDLQERLATRQRVCSYDRAGYGWSDFVAAPATAARSADELHEPLSRATEPGPYLLIGHSYGGFILRWFALRHGDEVAGLVLLDSSAPEQFERLPLAALPQVPSGPPRRALRMPQLPAGFPATHSTTAMALMLLPKARLASVAELRGFAASAHALAAAPERPLRVPIVVVSRGRGVFDEAAGGAASDAVWRNMQSGMTRLSSHAAQWIARGAGHLVHLDRPDLVLRAVGNIAAPATSMQAAGGSRNLAFAAVLMSPPP